MSMDIKRTIYHRLKKEVAPNKVVALVGPRRVGKTYLLTKLAKEWKRKESILYLTGEQRSVQDAFSVQTVEGLASAIGDHTLVVIDEAQYIPHVGLNLKIIVDQIPGIKVIVSGSSSLSLAHDIGEPLVGRKTTLQLYSISAAELLEATNAVEFRSMRDDLLIYGAYPQVITAAAHTKKQRFLLDLVDSVLLKDILMLEKVKGAKPIRDLLSLVAYQIGQEVSLSELASALNLNRGTVGRYLDLLEQSFVLVNVRGFSRNLRKEVTKNSRYYFYDSGVRNAVINNFNPLHLRNDIGQLWENYVVMERLKKQTYRNVYANNYFWRTWDKKEIDWVEERDGKLFGYEITWGKQKKSRSKTAWLSSYPKEAEFALVNRENYFEFIM